MMWGHIVALASLGGFLGGAVMSEPVGFVDRFKELGTDWHVAEYDFAHDKFDTDWRQSQVQIGGQDEGEGLELRLQPHEGGINRFAGGSIRREDPSHYGCYEVRMQAASHPGVVTGFFTYTGPHYGTRHDEIDIEFLGRNTRQMHVAWFIDGKLQNRFVDLGFDAAEKMVDYAFEWQPDQLRWFANGALIFEYHANPGAIPAVPGRLFVNLWAADPSISNWAGTTMPDTQAKARVAHVRFTPLSTLDRSSLGGGCI